MKSRHRLLVKKLEQSDRKDLRELSLDAPRRASAPTFSPSAPRPAERRAARGRGNATAGRPGCLPLTSPSFLSQSATQAVTCIGRRGPMADCRVLGP